MKAAMSGGLIWRARPTSFYKAAVVAMNKAETGWIEQLREIRFPNREVFMPPRMVTFWVLLGSTTTKPHGEVRHGYGTRAEQESSRGTQREDILSSENVSLAWKKVRGNKGAAGVDGMEVGDFPDFYAEHWEMIHRKLLEGSYSPTPVRRVMIPKGKGK